jgi:hypothetical protein
MFFKIKKPNKINTPEEIFEVVFINRLEIQILF